MFRPDAYDTRRSIEQRGAIASVDTELFQVCPHNPQAERAHRHRILQRDANELAKR
jgi:hypothetical protein